LGKVFKSYFYKKSKFWPIIGNFAT